MTRRYVEDQIQASIVELVCAVTDPREVLIYAVPNGAYYGDGRQRARQGARMKWTGVVPGVPDLVVLWGTGDPASSDILHLEVKAPKGRLSDAQKEIHPRLRDMGFGVVVVCSVDEAEAALIAAGVPMRGRIAA